MKKILLLICLFAGNTALQAQIMSDSTVQICAYWTPGEKYAYDAKEEKLKIDKNGDTTFVYRQSERRTFEILSQTKDRYRIRLSYSDYVTTDEADQRMHDAIIAATGPCIVEFETDETGLLTGITNLETLLSQAKASVKPAMEAMWKGMDAEQRKMLPKKNFQKYMSRALADPSVVINAVNDDLGRMFFFHGARLDTAQVYEVDETFAPLLGGQDSLRCKTRFWIDSEKTDTYSAICDTYTEADGREIISTTFGQVLQMLNGKQEVPQALRDSIAAGMGGISSRMEQYSSEEVHLDTGWPLHLFFERTLTVGIESKSQSSAILRRTLDIVLEENE